MNTMIGVSSWTRGRHFLGHFQHQYSLRGRSDTKQRSPATLWPRAIAAIFALFLSVGVVPIATASPAVAYEKTGCKWPSGNLRIDYRSVTGVYRSALTSAKNHYNSSTDVKISLEASRGPTWTAASGNYGATGWNGRATWTCASGKTLAAQMRLNQYYISSNQPFYRIRLVWLHEMGHSLGLAHVSSSYRVMYRGGTGTVYSRGIKSLTSDEKRGINALY